MVYEMSAGRELPHLFPEEEDYRDVEGEGCGDILRYIFARKEDGQMEHTIAQVG